MANSIWTVDSHCHWSDARVFREAPERIEKLIRDENIKAFLLGGVEPEEWRRQNELQRRFPNAIFRGHGLHPYTVDAWDPARLQAGFEQLSEALPDLDAIGEIGLDYRPQFKARERQLDFFERQLGLAGEKAVLLHIVRAHEEALKILRAHQPPNAMVHAFTGGPEVAKRYLDLGVNISVGAKLLFTDTHSLHAALAMIPLERLLLESDCPDQPPPGQKAHDSSTIWRVAQTVAEIKKLSFATVVEQTRSNLFALLKKESPQC